LGNKFDTEFEILLLVAEPLVAEPLFAHRTLAVQCLSEGIFSIEMERDRTGALKN
jgi:hypothetical protein